MSRNDEGGWLRKLDAKINTRFPYARWIVAGFLALQFLWRAFNGVGDMIDAYSHAQFLAQHREAVIAGLKSGITAVFSPIGSLITTVLGVAYLVLDRKLSRDVRQELETKAPEIDITPQVLISNAAEPTETDDAVPNLTCPRVDMRWIADPSDESGEGGIEALVAAFQNSSRSDKLVGSATNVTAELTYQDSKGGVFARSLFGVWKQTGLGLTNRVDFSLNSVRELVLLAVRDKEYFTLEDLSEGVASAAQLLPFRYILQKPLIVKVILIVDGKRTSYPFEFTLRLDVNPPFCSSHDLSFG